MKLTLQSEVTPEVYATIKAASESLTCESGLLIWLAEMIQDSIDDLPRNSPLSIEYNNVYRRILDEPRDN